MGQSYYIECQQCDYHREVTIGVGFLFGNVKDISLALNKQDKATVEQLDRQSLIHSHYSKGYSIYQCEGCHSLENKCHLELYDNEGEKIFEIASYCSKCQKQRAYLPEDSDQDTIPDLKCPKCHHDQLAFTLGKLWD